jgi:ergothioneine biosynthesis protein EgtB
MIDRPALVNWYRRNRAQSRALFDLIDPAAYYTRPIALRNPIVFYEGHLPAFSLISLVKRGLGRPGVDQRLEALFARGIDPESESAAVPRSGASTLWPSREEVTSFAARADGAVIDALQHGAFDLRGLEHPAMHGGEAIYTALEHEAMHQETLLYMWHRLPHDQKRKPSNLTYETGGAPPDREGARVPAGRATLGLPRGGGVFGWDNEFESHVVDVPAFEIDVHSVTNADFLSFADAGGYADRRLWTDDGWEWVQREGIGHPAFWSPSARVDASARSGQAPDWYWRGMFEDVPLPLAWPVYVSHAEASAYARWKGRRLPTEAEYHRAAFGTPEGRERPFPWGDQGPDATLGNFDFQCWEPVPAGARPQGASAWGVHDLAGNGWEWTSSVFAPYSGFQAMASYPEYSVEFFDGHHYVMKGASPATARALIRRSFRNWFRPTYPYVYAKFRTAF